MLGIGIQRQLKPGGPLGLGSSNLSIGTEISFAAMLELEDKKDLKSFALRGVPVQVGVAVLEVTTNI